MEKLVVRVTLDDIEKGVEANVNLCPIARAVRRLGKKRVTVGGWDITTRGNKVYRLPQRAEKFIDAFDQGEKVKPFKFTAVRDLD